jgi:hypothetical protein
MSATTDPLAVISKLGVLDDFELVASTVTGDRKTLALVFLSGMTSHALALQRTAEAMKRRGGRS